MENEEEIKYSGEIPPIYEELNKYFSIEWKNDIIITYGGTMYSRRPVIRPDVMEHEKVHVKQQKIFSSPAEWYAKYIHNPEFRLEQELEAYKAQVKWIRDNTEYTTRDMRRSIIRTIASELSSSIYGNIITYHKALELLK